jgi:hypothetical protein
VREEMALEEAAPLFGVPVEELELALHELQLDRGTSLRRRLVRYGDSFLAHYRREDIEEAVSRLAARRLGFPS